LVLYVSHKTTPWPSDAKDIEDITTVALSRNAALRVTGVLISTDFYFAQILEGPSAAVDEIMASILRDCRHHHLEVLADRKQPKRWFPNWSLAFAGRSSPLAAHIEPSLAQPPKTPKEIEWLLLLMRALVRPVPGHSYDDLGG